MKRSVMLLAFLSCAVLTSGQTIALPNEYDWTTCQNMGSTHIEGLIFNNGRWSGQERGCMFVRMDPPHAQYWFTHQSGNGLSSPNVAWGNVFNDIAPSSVGHLPVKLNEIEEYVCWMDFSLGPKNPNAQFKVYNQMWFSSDGKNVNAGDFAPTFYAENCDPNWWGTAVGTYEIGGTNWRICDCGYNQVGGSGRYFSDQMSPYPTPDANRRIVVGPIDFKALIDWHIQQGNYPGDIYMMSMGLLWEILAQSPGTQMCNNFKIVFKRKGKERIVIPSWSTMGGKTEGKVRLSVDKQGDGSIVVTPNTWDYDSGAVVTVQTVPDGRSVFTGWSGDLSGTNPDEQLVMDSDKSITATFAKDPNAPIIINGSFSAGNEGWFFYQDNGNGGATMQVSDGVAVIASPYSSSEWWHVQLHQLDLPLSSGDNLELQFDARAASERTLNVVVKHLSPDVRYLDTTITLSSSMQSYTMPVVINSDPQNKPRLEFNLGKASGDVYIDNVALAPAGTTPVVENTTSNFYLLQQHFPIAHTNGISWRSASMGPWNMEVYDMRGNRLAQKSGVGRTATVAANSLSNVGKMVVVKLRRDGITTVRNVQLIP